MEGTHDEKTNFYTSLYHLYIQPNNIADVDGRYVGPNEEITQSPTGTYYSTLSQWDTFRAAFPMYTILSPEIISELVNAMTDYSGQQGHLPIWALMGKETFTMIGNHYTEGNALQYTWHVMQDIPGLIELMGGKEKTGEQLDYLFNTTQQTTGNLSAENMYVDKIEWNGAPYEKNFITYEQIMGGGTLLFHMTDTPKDR